MISGGRWLARRIALVIIMISLIGGRIIPSFTQQLDGEDEASSRPLPTQPQSLDLLVIARPRSVALLARLSRRIG